MKINNFRGYHNLYLKIDTLLLAEIFKNLRKICLKIYHFVKLLAAPILAWKVTLKKTEVKLELLTDIDMLLMLLKKALEEENIMQFIDMQKLITNIDYDKKELSYLKYCYVNNLYGWAMLQSLQ